MMGFGAGCKSNAKSIGPRDIAYEMPWNLLHCPFVITFSEQTFCFRLRLDGRGYHETR